MSDIKIFDKALTFSRPEKFSGQADTFQSLVTKLISGDDLSEAELSVLKNCQIHDENLTDEVITQLRQYVKLKGSNSDTDGVDDELDTDPFKSVDESQVRFKQSNFRKELEAAHEKLKKVFPDLYQTSKASTAILSMIDSIPTDPKGRDEFQKAVKSELQDRNNPNPALDGLSNAELNLLARGTLANLGLGELLDEDPEVELPSTEGDINAGLQHGATAQDWLSHLKSAQTDLPTSDQYTAEYLSRKLENLEELDASDFNAMKSFLQLKAQEVSDSDVSEYVKSFNSTVQNLKALKPGDDLSGLSDKLKSNIFAHNATLPADIPPAGQADFVAAMRMLESPNEYNANNSSLQKLETIYSNANPGRPLPEDLSERKQVLETFAKRIVKQEQAEKIDDKHYSKADPELFFEDFKKQALFIGDYVFTNARTPAEREALQEDLIRFVRGQEPSEELLKAFGKGTNDDQTDKLRALNFLDRGSGNPRATVGLLKAMFTMPYEENGVMKDSLYFHQLVKESNSFEELAVKLRDAIGTSKFGDNDHKIPPELLADQRDKEVALLGSLAGFHEGQEDKEVNGQVVKVPNGRYKIFDDLGFDVADATFDTKSEKSLAHQLRDIDSDSEPSKIYTLMSHLLGSDEEINKVLKLALDTDSGDDEESSPDAELSSDTLADGGKPLVNFLLKAIKDKEKKYLDYDGYTDESPTDFIAMSRERDELIKFSEENELGLYQKDEMLSMYHENEYEQMLKDFAMSIKHMKPMMESGKAFYQTPAEMTVDYRIPAAADTATASLDTEAGDLASLADVPGLSQTTDWFNEILRSSYDYNSNMIFANIFGDEEQGSDDFSQGLNNPYLISPFGNGKPSFNNFSSNLSA